MKKLKCNEKNEMAREDQIKNENTKYGIRMASNAADKI